MEPSSINNLSNLPDVAFKITNLSTEKQEENIRPSQEKEVGKRDFEIVKEAFEKITQGPPTIDRSKLRVEGTFFKEGEAFKMEIYKAPNTGREQLRIPVQWKILDTSVVPPQEFNIKMGYIYTTMEPTQQGREQALSMAFNYKDLFETTLNPGQISLLDKKISYCREKIAANFIKEGSFYFAYKKPKEEDPSAHSVTTLYLADISIEFDPYSIYKTHFLGSKILHDEIAPILQKVLDHSVSPFITREQFVKKSQIIVTGDEAKMYQLLQSSPLSIREDLDSSGISPSQFANFMEKEIDKEVQLFMNSRQVCDTQDMDSMLKELLTKKTETKKPSFFERFRRFHMGIKGVTKLKELEQEAKMEEIEEQEAKKIGLPYTKTTARQNYKEAEKEITQKKEEFIGQLTFMREILLSIEKKLNLIEPLMESEEPRILSLYQEKLEAFQMATSIFTQYNANLKAATDVDLAIITIPTLLAERLDAIEKNVQAYNSVIEKNYLPHKENFLEEKSKLEKILSEKGIPIEEFKKLVEAYVKTQSLLNRNYQELKRMREAAEMLKHREMLEEDLREIAMELTQHRENTSYIKYLNEQGFKISASLKNGKDCLLQLQNEIEKLQKQDFYLEEPEASNKWEERLLEIIQDLSLFSGENKEIVPIWKDVISKIDNYSEQSNKVAIAEEFEKIRQQKIVIKKELEQLQLISEKLNAIKTETEIETHGKKEISEMEANDNRTQFNRIAYLLLDESILQVEKQIQDRSKMEKNLPSLEEIETYEKKINP